MSEATFWLVYQDSNPNNVVALFRVKAEAEQYMIDTPHPGQFLLEARVLVPFQALQPIVINPI